MDPFARIGSLSPILITSIVKSSVLDVWHMGFSKKVIIKLLYTEIYAEPAWVSCQA